MATTFMDKQQKALLKKFHVLLGKTGAGTEGKEAILQAYGVESSKDLSAKELLDICDKLTMQSNPKLRAEQEEMDRLRKNVMGAIGSYLRASGQADRQSSKYIKEMACRASGCGDFNKIPASKLRAIQGEFSSQAKACEIVKRIVKSELLTNINLN